MHSIFCDFFFQIYFSSNNLHTKQNAIKNNHQQVDKNNKMQNIDLNRATQPYEYYMKHIKENRRPDARKLSDIRPCSVKTDCIQNTANGSAIVNDKIFYQDF